MTGQCGRASLQQIQISTHSAFCTSSALPITVKLVLTKQSFLQAKKDILFHISVRLNALNIKLWCY